VLALFVLCLLVYYFSYDHGRSAARARLAREEADNSSLRLQLELQNQELEGLKAACPGVIPGVTAGAAPRADGQSGSGEKKTGPVNYTFRVGENKNFFSGRLIVTVVAVNSLDQDATVRLHYVDSARRETSVVKTGRALTVRLDDRESQLFLDQLKGSLAFFSFYENQSLPDEERPEPPESESDF
jgi:hypothetical protein